jgi:hypothetical protein
MMDKVQKYNSFNIMLCLIIISLGVLKHHKTSTWMEMMNLMGGVHIFLNHVKITGMSYEKD